MAGTRPERRESTVKHPGRRKPIAEINVVPYIDVMLVLLIVFMVTAPMLTQGVQVELPEAPSKPLETQTDDEPLIVSIKKDGTLYLNLGGNPDEAKSLEAIQEQVSKVLRQQPKTEVLINGDQNIDYGRVVQVMTGLQAAGARSVGLVTEAPTELP